MVPTTIFGTTFRRRLLTAGNMNMQADYFDNNGITMKKLSPFSGRNIQ
jgi:hypothetical protein